MNPLAIAAALHGLEDDNDLLRSSVELFWALFRDDLTEEEREKLSFDPEAAVGDLDELLRELTELTPLYVIDEPGDPETLFVAAHLQASRLALYLMQSAAGRDDRLFGYGEDGGLYAQPLERLIARLRRSMPRRGSLHEFPEVFQMSVSTIESLAERVGAELAAQRGEYAEALARLVNSLTCAAFVGEINEAWEHSENPEELVDLAQACPWRTFSRMVDSGTWFAWTLPWLSGPELPTQQAAQWFEALKAQPSKHDWSKLAATFNDLANEALGTEGLEDVEVDGWGWDFYWFRAGSWAENQLTADQLRARNEAVEDQRAEERLRAYFFDEAQWEALSEHAKEALISADRAWVSSENKAQILDQLQMVTEDILYYHLWRPLLKWADGRPDQFHRLKDTRDKLAPEDKPKLSRYETILKSDREVESYLRERLVEGDAGYVKNRVRKHFRKLRSTRNSYRHTTRSLGELRSIYAEFMGLGRDRLAVLPELVRILTQPPPK